MWDMRSARVWFSMGGFARLTPRVLRPLGDARCAPHTPHWDQIERLSFRFAEGQIGGLGAEQKTQSIGRSPIDCESFLRAPIVNQNSRAASVPRERSGVQIPASVFNPRERVQSPRACSIPASVFKSPRACSIRPSATSGERSDALGSVKLGASFGQFCIGGA